LREFILIVLTRNTVRFLFFSTLMSSLVACGGGSSTDSTAAVISTTAQVSEPKAIELNRNHIALDRIVGSDTIYIQTVKITLSPAVITKIASTGLAYFYVSHHDDQHFSVDVSIDTTNQIGKVRVEMDNMSSFDIGNYNDTVTIQGCYDENCADQFGEESFTIALNILPPPIVTSETIDITYDKQNPTNSFQWKMDLESVYGKNFEFKVEYYNSPNDWLVVSSETDTTSGLLNFSVDDSLVCGLYSADLVVTMKDIEYKHRFPVTFTLNSASISLSSVIPSVHYTNQPMAFTMRGCGLNFFENNTLELEGLNVVEQNYRNPFELEVIAGPTGGADEIPLTISNVVTEGSMRALTVIDKGISDEITKHESGQLFDLALFNKKTNITYVLNFDNEWEANHFQDGYWVAADFPFTDVNDVDLSSDQETLLIIKENKIQFYDANTYELLDEFIDEDLASQKGHFTSGKFLSNGQILLGVHKGVHIDTHIDLRIFDIKSKAIREIKFLEGRWGRNIWTSTDKSEAYAVFIGGEVMKYSPLEGVFKEIGLIDSNNNLTLNKNGNQFFVFNLPSRAKTKWSNKLFDENFNVLAELPKLIEHDVTLILSHAYINFEKNKIYARYRWNSSVFGVDEPNFILTFDLDEIDENLHPKLLSIVEHARD
jgi:hypothetical protein